MRTLEGTCTAEEPPVAAACGIRHGWGVDSDGCALRTAMDPSCVADREESEPWKLPKGVRAVPTMTGQRSLSAPEPHLVHLSDDSTWPIAAVLHAYATEQIYK